MRGAGCRAEGGAAAWREERARATRGNRGRGGATPPPAGPRAPGRRTSLRPSPAHLAPGPRLPGAAGRSRVLPPPWKGGLCDGGGRRAGSWGPASVREGRGGGWNFPPGAARPGSGVGVRAGRGGAPGRPTEEPRPLGVKGWGGAAERGSLLPFHPISFSFQLAINAPASDKPHWLRYALRRAHPLSGAALPWLTSLCGFCNSLLAAALCGDTGRAPHHPVATGQWVRGPGLCCLCPCPGHPCARTSPRCLGPRPRLQGLVTDRGLQVGGLQVGVLSETVPPAPWPRQCLRERPREPGHGGPSAAVFPGECPPGGQGTAGPVLGRPPRALPQLRTGSSTGRGSQLSLPWTAGPGGQEGCWVQGAGLSGSEAEGPWGAGELCSELVSSKSDGRSWR